MNEQTVTIEQFDRVKAVMATTLDADMSNVEMDTPSSLVPGWNSVSITVLVLALEDEFQVEMPLEAVFKIETVGELARQVVALSDKHS